MSDTLERVLGELIVIVVGLVFLAVGLAGALYQLEHPPINPKLIYTFIGLAVTGALLLPSIFDKLFPRAKQIWILIFPNGIPMLGGRRASDPPADPPGGPSA